MSNDGCGDWIGQKPAPAIAIEADASWDVGQSDEGCGLKGVLEEDRDIETTAKAAGELPLCT